MAETKKTKATEEAKATEEKRYTIFIAIDRIDGNTFVPVSKPGTGSFATIPRGVNVDVDKKTLETLLTSRYAVDVTVVK